MNDKIWIFIANHLPKKLIYHATIRCGAHATTDNYSSQVVPELSFVDTLKRWDTA